MHDLIRANLHRAPMFSGQIEGVGPRYCPSIEDKVVRFADRDSHTVFLEPESLRDDWVYCNGISTSLPADVQDQLVRAMPACARAEILRHGYAVEYDMVRPHQIHATGMTKPIAALFLAGQINGTSGYEEAAAQGLVAGINAALLARHARDHHAPRRGPDEETAEGADGGAASAGAHSWMPNRSESYLGVLMDDLVTKTPVEPYRMFTSRAEHRLLLRADNASDRLTPIARDLGLLSGSSPLGQMRIDRFDQRCAAMAAARVAIASARVAGAPLDQYMARPEFGVDDLARALTPRGAAPAGDRAVLLTILAERQYAGFITRQRTEIKRQSDMEHRRLPPALDPATIPGLRAEARQALSRFRPETFGQAGRLEGITPADITILAVYSKRSEPRA
jgi:tRNA uridine 5-carboxymethylaminomethyl modification enzyme